MQSRVPGNCLHQGRFADTIAPEYGEHAALLDSDIETSSMITVGPNPAVTPSSRSRPAMLAVSKINFTHPLIGGYFFRRTFEENRALHQDGNLLGKSEHQIHVVIDQQHRDLLWHGRDDVEDDMALRGRNSSGGFVE